MEKDISNSLKKKIHQDDISVLNIYASKAIDTHICKRNITKCVSHIKHHRLTVWDFNTPLSPTDRSSSQKLNREIMGLVDIINQMDLTYIYRTCHPRKNMHSSQHLMEPSSKLTTYSVAKQVSTDTRKLKKIPCIRPSWIKTEIQQHKQ